MSSYNILSINMLGIFWLEELAEISLVQAVETESY